MKALSAQTFEAPSRPKASKLGFYGRADIRHHLALDLVEGLRCKGWRERPQRKFYFQPLRRFLKLWIVCELDMNGVAANARLDHFHHGPSLKGCGRGLRSHYTFLSSNAGKRILWLINDLPVPALSGQREG